jgi:hypothetical protein
VANSIVERVYWTQFGDPVLKAVFVALADQANGQAFCWPSVDTIVERTEYSERSVRQKLKKLTDDGWIKHRLRPGHSSQYLINLDRLSTARQPRHNSREKGVWEEAQQLDELKRKFAVDPDEPALFSPEQIPATRGAGDSKPVLARGAGDSTRGAGDSTRGAPPAPRTIKEPPLEPPIEILGENDFTSTSHMVDWFAERWNEFASANKSVAAIRLPVADDRKDMIIRRTQSHAKGISRKAFWEEFFEHLGRSRFLRGLVPPTGQYTKSFSLKLNWALKPANLNEIMDGSYERNSEDQGTGSLGSAMSAAARVASRLDASGQWGDGS